MDGVYSGAYEGDINFAEMEVDDSVLADIIERVIEEGPQEDLEDVLASADEVRAPEQQEEATGAKKRKKGDSPGKERKKREKKEGGEKKEKKEGSSKGKKAKHDNKDLGEEKREDDLEEGEIRETALEPPASVEPAASVEPRDAPLPEEKPEPAPGKGEPSSKKTKKTPEEVRARRRETSKLLRARVREERKLARDVGDVIESIRGRLSKIEMKLFGCSFD